MPGKIRLPLLSFLLPLAFCVLGCQETVLIQEGQVTDESLPLIQKFVGSYPSTLEGAPAVLKLELVGNRVVLTSDRDLLGVGCNSEIGNLLQLSIQSVEGKLALHSALFQFNPERCASRIAGRWLLISAIPSQARLNLTILTK